MCLLIITIVISLIAPRYINIQTEGTMPLNGPACEDLHYLLIYLIALPNENKVDPRRAKTVNLIQYGYRKGGIRFSKHLRMATATTKKDKETEEEDKQERVKM